MDLILITPENIEREHICCAIASNKDCQVASFLQMSFYLQKNLSVCYDKISADGSDFNDKLKIERKDNVKNGF